MGLENDGIPKIVKDKPPVTVVEPTGMPPDEAFEDTVPGDVPDLDNTLPLTIRR